MSTWNPTPSGAPQGPPPGQPPYGPPPGPPPGAGPGYPAPPAPQPPYNVPPVSQPPYAPPPGAGAPPYGGGGPPYGTPGQFGGPGGPEKPHGRLSSGMIAVIVALVVAGGGTISYFAFVKSPTTVACTGSVTTSTCAPSTIPTTPPTSPISTSTSLGSSTTTSSVPTTTSSVPSTTSSVPPTTSSVPPTTSSTPTSNPSGQSSNTAGTITFSIGSQTLPLSYPTGWSLYQKGPPVILDYSTTVSFQITVLDNVGSTTVSSLAQNFLSSLTIQNLQGQQTTQTLNWQTFQQAFVEGFSGSISTNQGSSDVNGQVFVLYSSQNKIAAEILAVASSATNYEAANSSVLQIVNSLKTFG